MSMPQQEELEAERNREYQVKIDSLEEAKKANNTAKWSFYISALAILIAILTAFLSYPRPWWMPYQIKTFFVFIRL